MDGIVSKFETALKVFTDQTTALQNIVLTAQNENRNEIRQLHDEIAKLRAVIQTSQLTKELLAGYREFTMTMLTQFQEQSTKTTTLESERREAEFNRLMEMFGRMSVKSMGMPMPIPMQSVQSVQVQQPVQQPAPQQVQHAIPSMALPAPQPQPHVNSPIKAPQVAPAINFGFGGQQKPAAPVVSQVVPSPVAPPAPANATPVAVKPINNAPNATPATAASSVFGKNSASPFSGSFSSPFGAANPSMSFGALANQNGSSFLNNAKPAAAFGKVDPKQHQLFGGSPATNKPAGTDHKDGDEDAAPEEFVPDESQFIRPQIDLPDLVEVKTGEEDEAVLLTTRCRLYRFIPETKEVKERGTGDLKLLKHNQTGKIRVVMRREQVLKLCANFSIKGGFKCSYSKGKENQLVWTCTDFSDLEKPEGESLTMICRFKDKDTTAEFKKLTEE